MTSPYRIERDRGSKESRQQFAVLRKKWPLAFPVKEQDVRPLAIGITGEIAAAGTTRDHPGRPIGRAGSPAHALNVPGHQVAPDPENALLGRP